MNDRLIEVMSNAEGVQGDNPLYAKNIILKVEDYDWLIEQVAKEKASENQKNQLHTALSYYANKQHYEPIRQYGAFGYDVQEILVDQGIRATKALENIE